MFINCDKDTQSARQDRVLQPSATDISATHTQHGNRIQQKYTLHTDTAGYLQRNNHRPNTGYNGVNISSEAVTDKTDPLPMVNGRASRNEFAPDDDYYLYNDLYKAMYGLLAIQRQRHN